uniref:Copper resistance protein n=1 Tax=Mesocestoides corti TaxID=53468 RepID=A0A5K3ELK3_MESCO
MSSAESHMHHHEHGSADCKKTCGEAEKCSTGCHKQGSGHGGESCGHEKPADCTQKCHTDEKKPAGDCKGCCK